MFLPSRIDVSFSHYKPAIAVKQYIVTRSVASLLKVPYVNVPFLTESNGSTMGF
jgi:hypothetical protein